jgi:heparosan-N-sulfate-glucuronate 5-epimerase
MSRSPLQRPVGFGVRQRAADAADDVVSFAQGSLGAYFGVGSAFHEQAAGQRIDPHGLGGYYCDFSHKVAPSEWREGTWLAKVLDGAPWGFPMMVAQAALGFWERHLAGEPVVDQFLSLADWLVVNAERSEHGVGWRHTVPVEKYDLAPGWISGMAQGEAISVLLRGHALTGSERFREAAVAAFGPFTADVGDGGVVRDLDGALVVEEYPTTTPTAVLNGWIFGLLGLHELRLVTEDDRVAEAFARSREGLLTLLERYDIGWWSRYSLRDHGRADLAKPFYQRLHSVLLDAMDLIEPDPRLHAMARRWEQDITRTAMVRIAVDKTTFRVYREVASRGR